MNKTFEERLAPTIINKGRPHTADDNDIEFKPEETVSLTIPMSVLNELNSLMTNDIDISYLLSFFMTDVQNQNIFYPKSFETDIKKFILDNKCPTGVLYIISYNLKIYDYETNIMNALSHWGSNGMDIFTYHNTITPKVEIFK